MSGEGGQDPGDATGAPEDHPDNAASSDAASSDAVSSDAASSDAVSSDAASAGSDGFRAAPSGKDEEREPDGRRKDGSGGMDSTGARVDPAEAGFRRPTAMLDEGEFLGELAELSEPPDTQGKAGAEPAPPRGCRLIVVGGSGLGTEWVFQTPQVVIGRDEDCELVMSDIAVSRRHARLVLEGERFVLTDLGSGNGTFLNGVRIESETLYPGDEVTVGERTLRFVELSEAPRPTGAPAKPGFAQAPEPEGVGVSSLNDPTADGVSEPFGRSAKGRGPGEAPSAILDFKDRVLRWGRALRTRVLYIPAFHIPALRTRVLYIPAFQIPAIRIPILIPAVAVAVVLTVVCWRYLAGETPTARAARARRAFLVGVELVKLERFGDAQFFFHRVLDVRPEYVRAREYIAHCDREIARWRLLEGARALAASGGHREAIEQLARVSRESAYADDARRLKREYTAALAGKLVGRARRKWNAGDVSEARELLARALAYAPGLAAAHRLRARMDGAEGRLFSPRAAGLRIAQHSALPRGLQRVLRLYASGQIGAAVKAAEAVGGASATGYLAQLKHVQRLMEQTSAAHRARSAGELLRLAPAALEVDHALLGGQGRVRKELRRYYADGFFLRGLEALRQNDDVEAFRVLSRAVQVDPEHRLAAERLADLTGRVKSIYEGAYALRETDPIETSRVFRRILKMTVPSNPYHRLAARWLRRNGR